MQNLRILGKGKTALALKKRFPDATLYDDNDLESFDKNSNDLTIVSPGMPPHNKLVLSSKNIISDYDLFYDEMPFTIWISGTNGKTTTTQMCQYLLEKFDLQNLHLLILLFLIVIFQSLFLVHLQDIN